VKPIVSGKIPGFSVEPTVIVVHEYEPGAIAAGENEMVTSAGPPTTCGA
jgi:hypothetical protein